MFKLSYKNKAQMINEYVITIALVVAVVIAMSTLVNRGLKGRIKDANDRMIGTVRSVAPGDVPAQYEPYYSEQASEVTRDTSDKVELYGRGRTEGFFKHTFNEATSVSSQSNQLPPGSGQASY